MGQSSGLAAGQENAAAQLLQMLFEFLANGGRAAHDGEDALFDVIPALLLGKKKRPILDDRQGRLRGSVLQ